MSAVSFIFEGMVEFIRKMSGSQQKASSAVSATTEDMAKRTLQKIVSNASDGSGPNVVTGQLVSSWQVVKGDDDTWVVMSDSPYAERIEFGFVGVDSDGRMVEQLPLPYVRPAIDSMSKDAAQVYFKDLQKAFK